MARRGENIYKRKDGRYEGRYIKRYDINGKAVYGYVYSRSYAQVKEQLIKCKTEKKAMPKGANALLSEWLAVWLKSCCTIKATTKRVYRGHINNHIIPKIGSICLKKLTADILQNFVNNLKLAPSTENNVFCVLKSALQSAEDKGYITNIWSKIKLPRREKSIVQVLTTQEQARLESVLHTDNDNGILICLYTGVRIGELCSLKWNDVNFETAQIQIISTQVRTEKGVENTLPKTKNSIREIPMPDFLAEKLKAMPRTCDFVLAKDGKQMDIRTYSRRFKTLLQRAGLPDRKFHTLRHTFATRALEVGMDYKTLSEILGHSSVGITLDLYAHSLKEHKQNQMNKLNDIFHSPS